MAFTKRNKNGVLVTLAGESAVARIEIDNDCAYKLNIKKSEANTIKKDKVLMKGHIETNFLEQPRRLPPNVIGKQREE